MPASVAVVWFRRDLRLHDHPALQHALERYDRVLPLFVVDPAILAGRWRSANRRWFLAERARGLDRELRARDSRLTLAVRATRRRSFPGSQPTSAPRRSSPAATTPLRAGAGRASRAPQAPRAPLGGRDAACSCTSPRTSGGRRRAVHGLRAVPSALAVGRRSGRSCARPDAIRSGSAAGARPAGSLDELLGDPRPTADPDLLLEPGEDAARRRLARWAASEALRDYDTGRDRLAIERDVAPQPGSPLGAAVAGRGPRATRRRRPGPARFRSEIAWRDFYAHLLWHEPRVGANRFRRELDAVAWETDEPGDRGLARRPDRLPDRGRGDAPAPGDRLDAQPGADDRRLVPDEAPRGRLAGRRGALHGPPRRRRPRQQQRRLAVGRLDRHRSPAVLPDLQPDAPGPAPRPGRRVRPALGARSSPRVSRVRPSTSRRPARTSRRSSITARPGLARSPRTRVRPADRRAAR